MTSPNLAGLIEALRQISDMARQPSGHEPNARRQMGEIADAALRGVSDEPGAGFEEPWKVGDEIEYLSSADHAWVRGQRGKIIEIREKDRGRPRQQYQVFWVRPDSSSAKLWTTPSDVKLVSPAAPDPDMPDTQSREGDQP